MGRRYSTAANIVLNDKAPAELIAQLNAMVATKEGNALHWYLYSGEGELPGSFNADVAGLFRNHRHYSAEYMQRKVIVPGKHYVAYGTTKYGNWFVRDAAQYLLPYLDLEQSWFVAFDEGPEITVVRWERYRNDFVQRLLVREVCVNERGTLEYFDCDYIPWWFAEPIAKTLGTASFKKVLKRLTLALCENNDFLVVSGEESAIPKSREGEYRYVHRKAKAKKGAGIKHYRIASFFPVITMTFTENLSGALTPIFEPWLKFDFVTEPGISTPNKEPSLESATPRPQRPTLKLENLAGSLTVTICDNPHFKKE